MKASEWIDRVKVARGWDSDYRVAKELGFRPNTISQYRSHGTTLDESISLKVAAALGTAPEIVLLDQTMERMKTDEAKSAIGDLLKRLGGVAASLAMAVGVVSAPSPAEARTASPSAESNTSSVYYVKSRTRRRRNAMDVIRDTLCPSFTMAM